MQFTAVLSAYRLKPYLAGCIAKEGRELSGIRYVGLPLLLKPGGEINQINHLGVRIHDRTFNNPSIEAACATQV